MSKILTPQEIAYLRTTRVHTGAGIELLASHEAIRTERDAERQENARLRETLRSDALFLRHYLENYIVSVQTKDERGYVVNSFAALQIPDWAVKQRIDDIDFALAAPVAQTEDDLTLAEPKA